MISNRKIAGLAVLSLLLTLFTSLAAADPAQPPPPPKPSPPDGVSTSSYAAVTDIRSCSTGYNAGSNNLEYCNELYRQTKTKNIYFCDDNNNGQVDSGEAVGDFENPTPDKSKCANGGSYGVKGQEQRQYMTCGKNDAENTNTMNTMDVSSDWTCPSAKALSKRHESGDLEAGIGVSMDQAPGSVRSGEDISYSLKAAIPACVNRIPMIKLDVNLRDDSSGEAVTKSGIYAAHMNLYYGPEGSNAWVKEIGMPEQESYRRQYTTDLESKSYRMWAFRQRFAGAVNQVVQDKNLQLPEENVDVNEIASDSPSGKSVGDLWLSADFLYGAKAADPSNRTVEIERDINASCSVDVTEISERSFEDANEFVEFVEDNENQAIDDLGKSGGNYCDLGEDETIIDLRGAEPSGGVKILEENLTGFISTKILDNETGELRASVDVRDLDTTFQNEDGETQDLETGEQFMRLYEDLDEERAEDELKESVDSWNRSDLSDKSFTDFKEVENPGRETGTLEVTVDVRNLDQTFINDSGEEENLTTSSDFNNFYDDNQSGALATLEGNKGEWDSDEDVSDKRIDSINNINSDGDHNISFEADYTVVTNDVSFTASYTRYMTGEDFEEHSNSYIENQLEKHVYGANNSLSDAVKPVDRFEGKQVYEIGEDGEGGVMSTVKESEYEGRMRLETAENIAQEGAFVYYTYRKTEKAEKSWNWRALQGVSMTTLAKCMYNWEDCMNNQRDLDSRSWSGHEVYDAGYGPWENTNTFSWSATAAQRKGEYLQGNISEDEGYNQTLTDEEIEFDKQYDGARGTSAKTATSVNVYRKCTSDMGWKSAEGEFYEENHFICPDSDETNQEAGSTDPSNVYRCMKTGGGLPSEVRTASEFEAKKLDGKWQVCRKMSVPKWYEDEGPPELYVQKEQLDDDKEAATVVCEDEIATCEEDSYRMKIYEPGEQPLECPEDYSAYETEATSKQIGTKKYVCATAKDKVGKVGFSSRPVKFGAEAESENIAAELVYASSTIKVPYGQSTHLFYSVTNNADQSREVRVDLNGVNATFTDGTESKDLGDLVPGEKRDLEIVLQPAVPGNGTFWVETTDEDVGYKLNDTIKVRAPSQIGGVTQGEEESVPGIGLVHVMVLAAASAAYFLISRP